MDDVLADDEVTTRDVHEREASTAALRIIVGSRLRCHSRPNNKTDSTLHKTTRAFCGER